jgi:hypothetical protein
MNKVDLSNVPTCELHAELARREGVEEIFLHVDQNCKINIREVGTSRAHYVSGPARILINED